MMVSPIWRIEPKNGVFDMYQLHVPKMHCGGCAGRVTRAVAGVDPSALVKADLATREISVETKAELSEIREALDRIGYPAAG